MPAESPSLASTRRPSGRRRLALPLLLIAIAFARPVPAFETYASHEDLIVRVAVAQGSKHLALACTNDYAVTNTAGKAVTEIRAHQLYFIDLSEDGAVVLRDARGVQLARERGALLFRPPPGANAAFYLQSIRDLTAWRATTLAEAPSYRDALRVGVGSDRLLVAVNELPLERYLYGVVGAEIGGFAPTEALKAQAVAARSEAFAKLHKGRVSKEPLFDFRDSTPQVYRGWRDENARVRGAVEATRGMILTWHGRPVDAVYGHSCGGVVAEVSEIWGGAPLAYSRRRWDRSDLRNPVDLRSWQAAHDVTRTEGATAWCSPHQDGFPRYAEKHFRWRRSFSAAELMQLLDPVYNTGRIRRIVVDRRSPSGRVQRLRIEGSRRTVVLDRELHIRGALGSLKSTFFTFTTEEAADGALERLTIYGAGYGHGAGMCQMGAFMMGHRGYAWRDILSHYYSGVSIAQIYP
jgi:stage II sporulation protein D